MTELPRPDRYRLTILGCGSSGGVPRIGGDFGACDPKNPKNHRRRCSLLVQRFAPGGAVTSVLIDASPDARAQLLDAGIGLLDAVVFTHEHADHTHGIDELRVVFLNGGRRVPSYADARTQALLDARFDYCFRTPPGSSYPPCLEPHEIAPLEPLTIEGAGGGITLLPFEQVHGSIPSLGFRIGAAAYSSDLNDLPQESLAALGHLDLWIVDALRYRPHPSHFSVDGALGWIARLQPNRAVLTNMHIDLDYAAVAASLPANVEPAYDGMVMEVDHAMSKPS